MTSYNMTVADVKEMLGYQSGESVRRLARENKIPSIKHPGEEGKGEWRFNREEVLEALKNK